MYVPNFKLVFEPFMDIVKQEYSVNKEEVKKKSVHKLKSKTFHRYI